MSNNIPAFIAGIIVGIILAICLLVMLDSTYGDGYTRGVKDQQRGTAKMIVKSDTTYTFQP